MNVYIWDRVDPVSTEHHDSGAVVIVAESLPAARMAWENSDYVAAIIVRGRPDIYRDVLVDFGVL